MTKYSCMAIKKYLWTMHFLSWKLILDSVCMCFEHVCVYSYLMDELLLRVICLFSYSSRSSSRAAAFSVTHKHIEMQCDSVMWGWAECVRKHHTPFFSVMSRTRMLMVSSSGSSTMYGQGFPEEKEQKQLKFIYFLLYFISGFLNRSQQGIQ